ncbi:MAG: alpha/beta fold hydrolase [Pseudonocardiales bacterium]|nr:alpha/beta fold hydrolase [Pseudonocardiales bacterium]
MGFPPSGKWTGEAVALNRFVADRQVRRLPGSGVRYLVSGTVGPPLLILNGGTLVADTAAPLVTLFEDRFRTFTPWHPPLSTMAARVDVLLELLDQEGIGQIAVLGQSFGGTLAQALLVHAPEHVTKVVLSATGSPMLSDATHDALRQANVTRADLSDAVMMSETKTQLSGFLPREPALNRFWTAVLDDLFDHVLSAEDVRAFHVSSVDFFTNYADRTRDYAAWQGDALIVRADDDPALAVVDPTQLDSLFSRVLVHHFATGGHMVSVTQREPFRDVVTDFLLNNE